jgi:hypothetical protein
MRLPGLRGYFNPGEARVNRVATGSWFQDQSEFVEVGLGRNVRFFEVFFLGCVNRRKGIPMMYPCCFEWERGQRKGPMTVESEKS